MQGTTTTEIPTAAAAQDELDELAENYALTMTLTRVNGEGPYARIRARAGQAYRVNLTVVDPLTRLSRTVACPWRCNWDDELLVPAHPSRTDEGFRCSLWDMQQMARRIDAGYDAFDWCIRGDPWGVPLCVDTARQDYAAAVEIHAQMKTLFGADFYAFVEAGD